MNKIKKIPWDNVRQTNLVPISSIRFVGTRRRYTNIIDKYKYIENSNNS